MFSFGVFVCLNVFVCHDVAQYFAGKYLAVCSFERYMSRTKNMNRAISLFRALVTEKRDISVRKLITFRITE